MLEAWHPRAQLLMDEQLVVRCNLSLASIAVAGLTAELVLK